MTRVLVVNHDLDLGDIQGDLLRRAGYEVDQCQGPIGGDACPVLNGQPCWQVERADVLVYDAWAVDGSQDLSDDLRELHPDKPLVLTSAGPGLSWVETSGPHGVTPVAWSTSGVVEAIEDALRKARKNPQPPRKQPVKPSPVSGGPHW